MRACIFGAGEYHGEGRPFCENALIIAADGGLLHCDADRLTPELAIGDFDSLGRLPEGVRVITYPIEKDDTDTALAVEEAIARGADEILLFGALGGRLDHTLANITLLRALSQRNIPSYIVGEREVLTVLSAGERLAFDGEPDGIFSLFSLSDESRLTLTGVKYPLEHGVLRADRALGVSNRFLKRDAAITVCSGEALLCFEREGAPMPRRERVTVS